MLYVRFFQIYAVFHPKDDQSNEVVNDHQPRNAITKSNMDSRRTFVFGRKMPFDKGGIPSRPRYKTVRQYNSNDLY